MNSRILNTIILFFVIIGAVNWVSMGLFSFNFISVSFGATSFLTRIVYLIMGVTSIIYYTRTAKQN